MKLYLTILVFGLLNCVHSLKKRALRVRNHIESGAEMRRKNSMTSSQGSDKDMDDFKQEEAEFQDSIQKFKESTGKDAVFLFTESTNKDPIRLGVEDFITAFTAEQFAARIVCEKDYFKTAGYELKTIERTDLNLLREGEIPHGFDGIFDKKRDFHWKSGIKTQSKADLLTKFRDTMRGVFKTVKPPAAPALK
eukprot:Platyproteum_vivax@DN7475_c1_g1_i2.p1